MTTQNPLITKSLELIDTPNEEAYDDFIEAAKDTPLTTELEKQMLEVIIQMATRQYMIDIEWEGQ